MGVLRDDAHDALADAAGHPDVDLEADVDLRAGKDREVLDHLLRDLAGVTTHAGRVEPRGSDVGGDGLWWRGRAGHGHTGYLLALGQALFSVLAVGVSNFAPDLVAFTGD